MYRVYFFRDTTELLNNLPIRIPKETILGTFDLKSLYSSIYLSPGKNAINFCMEQFPEELSERFSKEVVTNSLRFILKKFTLKFNDVFLDKRKVQRRAQQLHLLTLL